MKNKIVTQESEINTLKKIVSQRSDDFSQLKSEMSHIQNQLNRKSNKSNLEIESQIYSIPFIPLIDKIDLSRLIGKKVGLYEVELINIEDLEFTGIDPNIDFQLTLSTRLLNTNKVPQNGLISYYQYSKPQKGIINSTSSKLMVDAQNPYIFLEGNGPYQISGKLLLKISGKFK
ncbi:MAG: hypothetical protein HN820_05460 [Candidatus Marinimicrobia bacterium]|jgi:hypothetical protein|nr:hypothetical protein [Candidatus Neomarinimicrobiota bacterium]MBT5956409.1 hypothetical protein [Candidatus Neomarinimicrobiota bacterium]MBT6869988.1 hypothetical protein [Candidatus Neomarinimicrobiota bacterium]MBT7377586.1 hypothetical protein [Candidatus Neomarinimicrobiota bacterium]